MWIKVGLGGATNVCPAPFMWDNSPGFDVEVGANLVWGSELSNDIPAFDFKVITSSVRDQLRLCSTLVHQGLHLVHVCLFSI